MSRRLEIITELDKQVVVMVLAREAQAYNENEYYYLNSTTIRKENSTSNDPKYIFLVDENKVFQGIFKRLEDSDNPSCWAIVGNK